MRQDRENREGARGPLRVLAGVMLKPRSTLTALSTARRRWWWLPTLLMVSALALQGFVFSSANARELSRLTEAARESLPPQLGGGAPVNPMTFGLSMPAVIRVGGQVLGTFVGWSA